MATVDRSATRTNTTAIIRKITSFIAIPGRPETVAFGELDEIMTALADVRSRPLDATDPCMAQTAADLDDASSAGRNIC